MNQKLRATAGEFPECFQRDGHFREFCQRSVTTK